MSGRDQMWRAALTESVATAMLLFTLTCSITACLDSSAADPKLVVPIAVFVVAFLFLAVTVPLTGGHMSPVFTYIFALRGVVSPARAAAYVAAQCIGAVAGFAAIKLVMSPADAARHSLGGCAVGARGAWEALALECTCTLVVLFVGVTVALDPKRYGELGLMGVCGVVAGSMALAVFVSVTVSGSAGYAGLGLNPARCLGAAVIVGGELWHGHWVFWVGPLLTCSVYYALTLNFPRKRLNG